jgi:hypothetical protein
LSKLLIREDALVVQRVQLQQLVRHRTSRGASCHALTDQLQLEHASL